MKIYKKINRACGGAILYVDKTMLNHLGVLAGDEVSIELEANSTLVIKKPELDLSKVQEILKNAKANMRIDKNENENDNEDEDGNEE